MYVDRHAGAGFQDSAAELRIDFQGVLRIFLVHAPCAYFKGMDPFRILLLHESRSRPAQVGERHEVVDRDRADPPDTEHMRERLGHFIKIVVTVGFDKHPSVSPAHREPSLTGAQSDPDLADQRLLKDMPVLALDPDLGVFDQKSIVFIHRESLHFQCTVLFLVHRSKALCGRQSSSSYIFSQKRNDLPDGLSSRIHLFHCIHYGEAHADGVVHLRSRSADRSQCFRGARMIRGAGASR